MPETWRERVQNLIVSEDHALSQAVGAVREAMRAGRIRDDYGEAAIDEIMSRRNIAVTLLRQLLADDAGTSPSGAH